MVTPYLSQQPIDDFGNRFSDLKFSVTLAASTDTSFTVPGVASRYKALLKCDGTAGVWVALNKTATVPAGGTFSATDSELFTSASSFCREVRAGDVLHFITAGSSVDVNIDLYSIGTPN